MGYFSDVNLYVKQIGASQVANFTVDLRENWSNWFPRYDATAIHRPA